MHAAGALRFLLLAQLGPLPSAAWSIMSSAGKRWCDLLVMSVFPRPGERRCHCPSATASVVCFPLSTSRTTAMVRIPPSSGPAAETHICIPSETCQHASAPSPGPQAGLPAQWHVPGFQMHSTPRPSPASQYLSCKRPTPWC